MPEERSDLLVWHGLIEQRQKGSFVVRIRTRAGNMTSDQLRKVAELADKYAWGEVHFTARQSVEMYGVPENQVAAALQEAHDSGLLPAIRGARVKPIVACPGAALCKFGIGDARALAGRLDELLAGRELPKPTRIGISGCPNSCAKPQVNDIGLHGVVIPAVTDGCGGCQACVRACKVHAVEIQDGTPHIDPAICCGCGICVRSCPTQALYGEQQGYAVYVGGRISRQPQLGRKIFAVIPEAAAIACVEAILAVYSHTGRQGERLADVINRLGLEDFRQAVLAQDFC